MSDIQIYPELVKTVNGFLSTFQQNAFYSAAARDLVRQDLAVYLKEAKQKKEVLALNFVCTHNSRRSQIAQIWTMVASAWFDHGFARAYSGGTEVTALHPNVVKALVSLGFRIESDANEAGRYLVHFSDDCLPIACWSKLYNDAANPAEDFLAIMVCDDADANCPVIPAAKRRISLQYVDPKFSDGTAKEAITYKQTAREIGSEIFSLFES